ncbi:MAG TPA: SMI1/KNR4 family protein [Mucilaginibacter sp.]|nr:SMI1/KNR4 family protein [Mucilaginibacter sp.]
MEDILRKISSLAIQLQSSAFTDTQKQLNWLGSPPASLTDIEIAENRLGVKFPKDYKNLLLITNGFFTPCDSNEPTFETVEKVDYLRNIDTYLLEIWNEGVLADVGEQLNRAIVVGGLDDEQYFFLIPPIGSENWQYWKFANWIPGEESYQNLNQYFTSVLDFMESIS